jgi:ketosteroid isomerase-like protein
MSNVEIVRAALEAFRVGDVDVALKHIHPDMVSKRIEPDGAVFHGREWADGANGRLGRGFRGGGRQR